MPLPIPRLAPVTTATAPTSDFSVPKDALDLEVVGESELAPLAPVAALLVAAERAAEVERVVDVHRAGPEPLGDGAGLLLVGACDVGRQPVLGVVGDRD